MSRLVVGGESLLNLTPGTVHTLNLIAIHNLIHNEGANVGTQGNDRQALQRADTLLSLRSTCSVL